MVKNEQLFNPDLFEYNDCNLCGAKSSEADIVYGADLEKIPQTAERIKDIYSSASSEVFYEKLVRCKRCGLIYVSPRPKRELVINGYSSAQDQQYVSQERGRMLTFQNCLKIVKRLSEKGKLLDIGAASGIFVKVACDAGYEACGIEPSVWMSEFAKKHYGVDVFAGILEDKKSDPASFDIVTMWDVLEHVPDPMSTLKEVSRILKPGGYLIVNYPRIDALARIFGRKWWFFLSIHLFYFTPQTLSSYMEKSGFEKIGHKPHFQRLAYGYLVERLSVYSKPLAAVARLPYMLAPGLKEWLVPYFASQYLMIARKKG